MPVSPHVEKRSRCYVITSYTSNNIPFSAPAKSFPEPFQLSGAISTTQERVLLATRWCVPSGGAGSLACEEAGFGIRDLGVGLLHLLGCCLLCQFTHALSLHLVNIL